MIWYDTNIEQSLTFWWFVLTKSKGNLSKRPHEDLRCRTGRSAVHEKARWDKLRIGGGRPDHTASPALLPSSQVAPLPKHCFLLIVKEVHGYRKKFLLLGSWHGTAKSHELLRWTTSTLYALNVNHVSVF